MVDGGKAGGVDRPAASAVPRTIPPSLAGLGVVTLAGLAYLAIATFSAEHAIAWVISAALVACISLLHLRHALLALAVAIAPLAGVLWCAALMHLIGASPVLPAAAYALGVTLAVQLSDRFVAGVLAERTVTEAASRAMRDLARPSFAAIVVAVVLILLALFGDGVGPRIAAIEAAIGWGLAALAVAAMLPPLFPLLAFDEGFVARANRARERRVTRAYRISMVSVPRWGLSVSGIALVLAMLGWFGAAPLPLPSETGGLAIPLAISAVAAFAVAYTAVDNWREALALSLASLSVVLLDLWAGMLLKASGPVTAVGVIDGLLLALVSMFVVASRVRQLREAGDDEAIARLRAIEELTGPCLFSAAAAAAVLLVWGAFAIAAAAVIGAAGALLFAPALATAIGTLLPRRRSVEELYKR